MKNTKIEWCDHTFNPWIGCTKVSPGCANCYAEALELRWGKDLWGKGKERQRTSAKYWKQPLNWNDRCERDGVRRRVFCASLADVFDDNVPYEWRYDLFELIEATPWLDWLLLTKRPENIGRMISELAVESCEAWDCEGRAPHNVWLGVSVEDQKRANERIPLLQKINARVHFLSVEPMLGPIQICDATTAGWGIDWVICGGESGTHCRQMKLSWAEALLSECMEYDVKFFMKQLGGRPNKRASLAEIPKDLQIREFPRSPD